MICEYVHMPQECPACGLFSPNESLTCDCGFRFGTIPKRTFLRPHERRAVRFALSLGLAVLGPLGLVRSYLMAGGSATASSWDIIVIVVSLALGTLTMVFLPLTGLPRFIVFMLYVPLEFYALMLLSVGYVCGHYGRCP